MFTSITVAAVASSVASDAVFTSLTDSFLVSVCFVRLSDLVEAENTLGVFPPSENPIPILTAKGDAEVAEAIIAEAEKQGVFIAEDKRLVSLLSQVELNEEIPENLYVSVAVILSWVYWLKGMRPEDNKDI